MTLQFVLNYFQGYINIDLSAFYGSDNKFCYDILTCSYNQFFRIEFPVLDPRRILSFGLQILLYIIFVK